MHSKKYLPICITGLLIASCAWSIFSNVPSWYRQTYDETTTFYSKGFGQSRENDLAVKKAVTEANSAMAIKCREYLKQFSFELMKKNGIDTNSEEASDYRKAVLRAEKKILQFAEPVKEETKRTDVMFEVFKLIKIEKSKIESLYLRELFD